MRPPCTYGRWHYDDVRLCALQASGRLLRPAAFRTLLLFDAIVVDVVRDPVGASVVGVVHGPVGAIGVDVDEAPVVEVDRDPVDVVQLPVLASVATAPATVCVWLYVRGFNKYHCRSPSNSSGVTSRSGAHARGKISSASLARY